MILYMNNIAGYQAVEILSNQIFDVRGQHHKQLTR